MRKEFQAKLNGDESRTDASASFTLPFDTRGVWGKAKVPVKVTINGYIWRSTVGNGGMLRYCRTRKRSKPSARARRRVRDRDQECVGTDEWRRHSGAQHLGLSARF